MKNIVQIILVFAASTSVAGNDQGGGGHQCKLKIAEIVQDTKFVFENDFNMQKKYPFWSTLINVINPTINTDFKIKIANAPINNCPLTEKALMCGRPHENILEVNCGSTGLLSLNNSDRIKHVLHELFWWTNLNDSNYFYSNKMVEDLLNYKSKKKVKFLFSNIGKTDWLLGDTSVAECQLPIDTPEEEEGFARAAAIALQLCEFEHGLGNCKVGEEFDMRGRYISNNDYICNGYVNAYYKFEYEVEM